MMSDVDLLLKSININDDGICSDDSSLHRLDTVTRRNFSCWDIIEADWLAKAVQDKEGGRIYVHREILEWIVEYINENILNENLRATVEEVHHHYLDGQLYLITFYESPASNSNLRYSLTSLKRYLKFKMTWRTNPTYFLRMDSNFADRKAQIMHELQRLNLLDSFNSTTLDVYWLYIPTIEVYEFSTSLTDDRIKEIDSIFEQMAESVAELYICEQFTWHRDFNAGDYVNMDTLAMDICAEEWHRHDLLQDFELAEIMYLDLANKDYRDPYFNEYLERYLDILIKKSVPQVSSDYGEKFDLPIYNLASFVGHYFVSRYYNKISTLWFYEMPPDSEFVLGYDIPKVIRKKHELHLKGKQPPIDELVIIEGHDVTYTISNYIHFSDSLFRTLLNKSNEMQTYNIKFDEEFTFSYGNEISKYDITNDCNWTFDTKRVFIDLENCIERNAEKLATFVKYMINVFKIRQRSDVDVSINFTKCLVDDYTFLQDIGTGIKDVKFRQMKFTAKQIKLVSCALAQQRTVDFVDCHEITDDHVMTLLENISFDRLTISGLNACTPTFYYLIAEHMMNKDKVDTIEIDRFIFRKSDFYKNFAFDFDQVQFYKDDDQIIIRKRNSMEYVDLYCLINNILDDDPIDYT